MDNKNLKNMSFWRLALRLGILFIIIVVLIQFLWQWFETGNLKFIKEGIESGKWMYYAISRLIFGAIYGLVSAYFLKRNTSKK